MKKTTAYIALLGGVFLFSCVSSRKFNAMQQAGQARYDSLLAASQNQLKTCNDANTDLSLKNSALQTRYDDLNRQLPVIKENNTQLLKQLQDLSVISSSQAESIKNPLTTSAPKTSTSATSSLHWPGEIR
jgi:chemotaxis protein MotB